MADKERKEVQQWEYHFAPPALTDDNDYYKSLGQMGWELVCIAPAAMSGRYAFAIFKRPKGVFPKRSHLAPEE